MENYNYLQDSWPTGTCYGCGAASMDGMHIKSRWADDGETVIAEYVVDPKYNAGLPGVTYGGTIASLIDCHSVWTAAALLIDQKIAK